VLEVAGVHPSPGREPDESSGDDAGAAVLPRATRGVGGSQASGTSAQASTSTGYGRGSVTTVNCGGTIQIPGRYQAVQLRVAEQYLAQFGHLAKAGNTLIVPATLSDVGSMLTMAMNVMRHGSDSDGSSASSAP
jgi:hypothetical protein